MRAELRLNTRCRVRNRERGAPARAFAVLACAAALACGEQGAPATPSAGAAVPQSAPAADARGRASVAIAGRVFELEVALDPTTRMRGLSGRREIPDYGGMLFVLPEAQPFYLVMRDCPIPIGAAFLDAQGVVLAVAEMGVEPPRAAGESPRAYEARLPVYGVSAGARMAVELQGGRLTQLGLVPGARVVITGLDPLLRGAK